MREKNFKTTPLAIPKGHYITKVLIKRVNGKPEAKEMVFNGRNGNKFELRTKNNGKENTE